jgi:hypothetical protein
MLGIDTPSGKSVKRQGMVLNPTHLTARISERQCGGEEAGPGAGKGLKPKHRSLSPSGWNSRTLGWKFWSSLAVQATPAIVKRVTNSVLH